MSHNLTKVILLIFIFVQGGLAAGAGTNEVDANTVEALRRIIERQDRKIEELSQKIQRLEEKENQRESNGVEPRLPAIIIDTNGLPLASISSGGESPAAPRTSPVLSIGSDGVAFISDDTNYVLNLHGILQADTRTFFHDNPLTQGDDGFLIRRARPIFSGTFFRDWDFFIAPDFAGSSAQLFDAFIDYRFAPELQFGIGKFRGPVGLENLQNDIWGLFNERSLASDLVPMRNDGAQLSGDLGHGIALWVAGIYDADGDYRVAGNNPFNNDLEYGGRLFLQPFHNMPSNPLQRLGIGLGGSYCNVTSNSAALPATTGGTLPGYVTTGQQQFFAYNPFLGPVVADGPHWRLSPQGYYYIGPFGVMGEYVISDQKVLNADTMRSASLENQAWEVSAQWVLTGEPASFIGIVPKHPFNFRGGSWGAWQLAARYSQLDIDKDAFEGFSDPTTSADRAAEWSVGLNWWLTANLRLMTSFSHTSFRGGGEVNDFNPLTIVPPATVAHQDENVFFTRIQLAF